MNNADDNVRLDIDDGGTDVEFGGRRHRPAGASRRPRSRTRSWIVAAVAAAVAAVTSVVVIQRSDEKSARPPVTSVAVSTTTRPAATNTTTVEPATSAAVPLTSPSLGPLIHNDAGWGLFVARNSPYSNSNSQSLRRIDLNSGLVSSIGIAATGANGRFGGAFGLSGAGADAFVLTSANLDNATSAAPGPDGTTWIATETDASGTPRTLRRVRATSPDQIETLASYDISQLAIEYAAVLGSTADGKPVFFAFDGSSFSYDPVTQTSTRLAKSTGFIEVSYGNYSVVECDDAANCSLVLHGIAGTVRLAYSSEQVASMSPDGTHAVVIGSPFDPGFVHTIDLRTGGDMATSEQYDSTSFSGQRAVWTPDGSHAVMLNQGHLATISADGTSVVDTPLNSDLTEDDTLIGIA